MRSAAPYLLTACLAGLLTAVVPAQDGAENTPMRLTYPETRRGDQVDDYHGERVADPYRWLEDVDSAETRAWVERQNEVTFGFLKRIPERKELEERLTQLWNFERFGLPVRRGGRYFLTRNDGLQNQAVLYVAESLDAEPRLLLDPNTLSADGTVALADWEVSEDGKLLAYGLASAGSDWQEWRVLDVASGKLLDDHLRWVKFSGASWLPDGSGFYYSRYDEPKEGETFTGVNYYQKLFLHRIGEPQSSDTLVYERRDEKEWGFGGTVTDDGRFLVITVWRGTERKNQVFYRDLRAGGEVVELLRGFDAEYLFLGNRGDELWFVTDRDAERRRVVAIDVGKPRPEEWRQVVPESEDVLRGASLVGGHLIANYMHDAHSRIRLFDLEGRPVRDLELPAIGTAAGFDGKLDEPETFFSFTNYTEPGAIYRYDVASGESRVFRKPKTPFDSSQFVTKQVFYTSKDGTRVPMFITHRKDLRQDGENPTLLYGYGGFNISLTPTFSVTVAAWLERGGIYAVPNLRGGGEYGRAWHEGGMLDRKQNVFDDFIGAAEYLIRERYTKPARLAIQGGSNGGLLVGAAITQRPELYGAALPGVGVMDMLRYHKFTIGWAWVSEYGSSDEPDQFRTIRQYSPLHNLRKGTKYPATMVTTADHDDRVVPGHSFKFAARLQECHAGDTPTLIRIETSAGHGAGTPTTKLIQAAADSLSFLTEALR